MLRRLLLPSAALLLMNCVASPVYAQKPAPPPGTVAKGKPRGDGWVQLLKGSNMTGFNYEADRWELKSGVLTGFTPGTKDHHYMYSEKEYSDFEMHLDVKLVGYNSGLCIRTKPTSFDDVPGYQVDMGEGYWGCLWDERGRGMVAGYPKEEAAKIVNKEKWNHYFVVAQGHKIEVWLNGVKTVDVVDEKGHLTGAIGFQLCHGESNSTEASFKNIWMRPLKSK